MKKRIIIGLFFLVSSFIYSQNKVYEKVKYPKGYTAELDIEYTQIENWKEHIDVYFNKKATKPTPIVLNIYGAGWLNGVKEAHKGFRFFLRICCC